MKKRSMCLLMVIALIVCMSGCGKKESNENSTPVAGESINSGTSAEGGDSTPEKPYEGVTLTYWVELNSSLASSYSNAGESEWAKKVMEETGINIEFIHPTVGSTAEEFSILCASGEYPDIIQYTWTKYIGGADAAIEDDIIIALDELIENNSPNLKAILSENRDVEKMIKTASGRFYIYPFLRGLKNDSTNVTLFSSAFIVRKDILDELGLSVPETVEEWDTVLRAYKSYGIEAPFCTRSEWMLDVWSGGFDNWGDFYLENGVVKNGIVEDSRKAFLMQLNTWYKDGLIDNDYLVATKKSNQTYFTTGKSAAVQAPIGQGLGTYTQLMNAENPEITEESIVACPPVSSQKGQNAKFAKVNSVYDGSAASAAISTDCKNKEAAAYLLDWMYSEQGNMVNNFGIEGVSYEMVEGVPTYTDLVKNNPDGLSFDVALAKYTSKSSPMIQDANYILQYYATSNQVAAFDVMKKTDMLSYIYPSCASILTSDSERATEITSYIKTYKEEMEAKFIAGDLSFNEWDNYVKRIKGFGLEELIEIKQRAYDNYMNN